MMSLLRLFQVTLYGNGRIWSRTGTRIEKHQIRILNPRLVSSFVCLLRRCSFLGTSITSLRLELAKEEAISSETGVEHPHDMTPALLIQNGLDLEEQQ